MWPMSLMSRLRLSKYESQDANRTKYRRRKNSERTNTCHLCCIMSMIKYITRQRTALAAVCLFFRICCYCSPIVPFCGSKTESSISFLSHLLPQEKFIAVVVATYPWKCWLRVVALVIYYTYILIPLRRSLEKHFSTQHTLTSTIK